MTDILDSIHKRLDAGATSFTKEDVVFLLTAVRLADLGQQIVSLARQLIVAERERDEAKSRASRQYEKLAEIRIMADKATGIDRSKNDERPSGAVGAVRVLVERYEALKADVLAEE